MKLAQIDCLARPREMRPFLRFEFFNHGRMPAVIERVAARLEPDTRLPPVLPADSARYTYEVIEPGGTSERYMVEVHGSKRGQAWPPESTLKLILHGTVKYWDAGGGTQYTDGFCFRLKEGANGLTLEYGIEYNYKHAVGPASFIERPKTKSPDPDHVLNPSRT